MAKHSITLLDHKAAAVLPCCDTHGALVWSVVDVAQEKKIDCCCHLLIGVVTGGQWVFKPSSNTMERHSPYNTFEV